MRLTFPAFWRQLAKLLAMPNEARRRVVIACAKAGLGIAVVSKWMCRAELESGELCPILLDCRLDL
jgi:DNA-binding transcriptional LysR family regulator